MAKFVSNRYTRKYFYIFEKKIRNDGNLYARCSCTVQRDQGNLHDVHACGKPCEKKRKDCEERRKIRRNLNGGISKGESNDTRDCIREKLIRVVGTRIAGGTPPGESILRYKSITNSIRSILDFDSVSKAKQQFLPFSLGVIPRNNLFPSVREKGERERGEKYGAIPTVIDRRPSMKLLARFHRSRQVFHSAGSETDVEM